MEPAFVISAAGFTGSRLSVDLLDRAVSVRDTADFEFAELGRWCLETSSDALADAERVLHLTGEAKRGAGYEPPVLFSGKRKRTVDALGE